MARRLERLRDRVDQIRDNPVVKVAVDAMAREMAARRGVTLTAGEQAQMATSVATAVVNDPVAQSQTDSEPWYQNRIKVGGLITALATILRTFNFDIDQRWIDLALQLGPDVFAGLGLWMAGAGTALAHRLAPIDWRRPWTVLGIGR